MEMVRPIWLCTCFSKDQAPLVDDFLFNFMVDGSKWRRQGPDHFVVAKNGLWPDFSVSKLWLCLLPVVFCFVLTNKNYQSNNFMPRLSTANLYCGNAFVHRKSLDCRENYYNLCQVLFDIKKTFEQYFAFIRNHASMISCFLIVSRM